VEDHKRDVGDHLRLDVTVVTATGIEARAARRALPGVSVIEAGIALAKIGGQAQGDAGGATIISCGVAGGLREDLPTGTVVIPREVLRADGTTLRCDGELMQRLVHAAEAIGVTPVTQPMVTTAAIVAKEERAYWANRGYAAVDMEAGLLRAARVAAVRVILDTPLHELSKDWVRPATAALKPWNWPQLVWLLREGPRCASLSARVIARALAD
jgi:Phosphorylase superfamily